MLPERRRKASGGWGDYNAFLLIFFPQFVGIFHRIAGFFSVNELMERLDGHNDSFAEFDGSDLSRFDQIRHEWFADVKHFCRLWNGYTDLRNVFCPLVFRLFRRCPHRNSDAGMCIEWNRDHGSPSLSAVGVVATSTATSFPL